jgi:hypothetical protein
MQLRVNPFIVITEGKVGQRYHILLLIFDILIDKQWINIPIALSAILTMILQL